MVFHWNPPDACFSIEQIRANPDSFPWYPADAGFCGTYTAGDFYYDKSTGGYTLLGHLTTEYTTTAGITLPAVTVHFQLVDHPGQFSFIMLLEEWEVNQGIPGLLDMATQLRQLYAL